MNDIPKNNPLLKVLNTRTLTGLIGDDDPELIRTFQIDFLKQAKESMAKIVNNYRSDQLIEIKEEAHFLKTSAKAIGAEQVAASLEDMEIIALKNDSEKCREKIVQLNNLIKKVYEEILNEK